MLIWLVAVLSGAAAAWFTYRERRASLAATAPPALLRAAALTLLVALLFDAPAGATRPVPPLVALDASASWLRARDSATWTEATRLVRAMRSDSVFLVGDSARLAAIPGRPSDRTSRVRPLVERALAAGRPLTLTTDGELDDPDALDGLPAGSRVIAIARQSARDAAVADLQAPRAVIVGDTTEVRVSVVADAGGAGAGTLTLQVGEQPAATASLDSLRPYADLSVVMRFRVPAGSGPTLVRALLSATGDAEPANDTLSTVVEISPAASAVLVSTSPDLDARDALVVLRGALALPTRGFYRVAPGAWRADGSLNAVTEAEVRRAVREAPLVILHGDTAVFGSPRVATRGALALLAPPADRGSDWYAVSAPPSPIAASLSGIPWDSLPPLDVSDALPNGEWHGLETRRARRLERRAAIAGTERPRRTVVVGASGFWRWRFRGGASADAFATLWGSIFDWLSTERSDVRAAVPLDGVLRAGDPVRWRRGAGDDSVVTLGLTRRGGDGRADSLTLYFSGSANLVESGPREPGVYDVSARGGSSLLVVNASRELLPRRPSVRSGNVGRAASLADAPRLRSFGWIYAVLLGLLCGEWLLRRRLGMR